jgi:NADPH:quinone reductase-like Zn-dependent oxidoreductase
MSLVDQPATYQAFRRSADGKAIQRTTEAMPRALGSKELLIKVNAVSLNYRDVAMLLGTYPVPCLDNGIPCSDASGTVVATGSQVKTFKVGDAVSPIFHQLDTDKKEVNPGGEVDGVLREYLVCQEDHLVLNPAHLTDEEISTVPCAGVTAWTALNCDLPSKEVHSALLQGTGGVSMFALLICLARGISPIITSSSDEKLNAIAKLGQEGEIRTINYKTHSNYDVEVLRLTDNVGVDVVVNNVGITSIETSLRSLRRRGTISLVGFLGGMEVDAQPHIYEGILLKSCTMR